MSPPSSTQLDMLTNLGSFCCTLFAAVTSLFGMNIISGLEAVRCPAPLP